MSWKVSLLAGSAYFSDLSTGSSSVILSYLSVYLVTSLEVSSMVFSKVAFLPAYFTAFRIFLFVLFGYFLESRATRAAALSGPTILLSGLMSESYCPMLESVPIDVTDVIDPSVELALDAEDLVRFLRSYRLREALAPLRSPSVLSSTMTLASTGGGGAGLIGGSGVSAMIILYFYKRIWKIDSGNI